MPTTRTTPVPSWVRLVIDGELVDGRDEPIAVIDPSTGSHLTTLAPASADDVDLAARAARTAFDDGRWSGLAPARRAAVLWRLAELIDANRDELGLLESLNVGKPLAIATRFEVSAAAETFRYCAGWATKLNGETRDVSIPGEWHAYTLRQPVGVAGLIVPWNVPLVMAAAKVAPALAAGCTVVLKPAELTPVTALRLGELALEAGVPPGVLNVVPGLGATAGQAIVDHPLIDKISFTGSTPVGQRVLASCAGTMKRVSLELGGKSPVFVFPDAHLDRAIDGTATTIFQNSGQVCAAGSRLFVHETIADEVVDGVAARAEALRIGGGQDEGAQLGPLISRRQQQRVLDYIERGRDEGATLVTGGGAVDRPGFFVQPTVLRDATPDMTIVREEIFGPVLAVQTFSDDDSLDDLVARGNDTQYGLNAMIWTRDVSRAHRFAARIRSGNVRINAPGGMDPNMPFGGFKLSGFGKENGREGVEAYTEVKSVAISLD